MATPLNNSIVKGFEILALITPERAEISARTVVAELDMTLATAHRLLTTLVAVGALVSYRRGIYCLGPRIEELGRVEQETNPLSEVVRPIIESASHDLNEPVMASRLSRGGPICMAVARSNRPISVEIKVGTIFPLHCSAQGKLWLASLSRPEREARLGIYRLTEMSSRTIVDRDAFEAELDRIRGQGFALNRGENEPDIGAVAVPVVSEDGKIFLTLSVFGLLSRFDERFIDLAVQRLGRAAREVIKRCL